MDPQTGQFTAYKYSADKPNVIGSSFTTTIESAGSGRLWVGTLGYGLDLFNTRTGEMDKEYFHDPENPNSLSEDTVYDLAVDSEGNVWIATARGGVNWLNPKTDTFGHYRHNPDDPTSLLSDTVYSLYLDETNGVLWAGTTGGLSGLSLTEHTWQNYSTRDGLPSDSIMAIEPGVEGELWISTGKGISRFKVAKKSFTNYDSRDGLQGDQFEIASSRRAPDGELFFGGPNGVTFFYPDQIQTNPYLPPVAFTDFQLFNQSVPAGSKMLAKPIERADQIQLTYDQSVFTLKFAALSYQHSAKNLYQYKMEGFDKDWSPPRSKQDVTYTSLPPGTYTFRVRAANSDGLWNQDAASILIIKILPPWWSTWWFRSLALLLIGLIVFGGIQMRINRIRSINRELEQRVVERTQELEQAQTQLHQVNEELKTQLAAVTLLEKNVRELAIRDSLTGLYNRHHLSEHLEIEYSRANRENQPIAFLLMDIDHFKDVNDTFGHQAGDQALKAAAEVITHHTRPTDIACRYGGEEFMVILPGVGLEAALHRAEELRESIQNLEIRYQEQIIRITLSIGVAVYPQHGASSDQILSHVDAALYQAKHVGRNSVIAYAPTPAD